MSNRLLFAHEDRIETRMGAAFLSERVVYRGKDLHTELGDRSWMELFLYGITGRLFDARAIRLLNYLCVSTSYPEPRIWCNRVAALAGSARTTAVLALHAANGVTEATIYGHRANTRCIDFLRRARVAVQAGHWLPKVIQEETARHGYVYGYGRPLASLDERIPHFLEFMRDLDLPHGEHLRLAFEIEDYFLAHKKIRMNIAAVYAGAAADLGLTAEEYHLFIALVHLAGVPPCFLDTREKPEGTFLPIRCTRVRYHGPARRRWPTHPASEPSSTEAE